MSQQIHLVLLTAAVASMAGCFPFPLDDCRYDNSCEQPPPQEDPEPTPEPGIDPNIVADSCVDWRRQAPTAPDGFYEVLVEGREFEVYCADMSGAPRAYLPLAEQNVSQYTAGAWTGGTTVVTDWEMVSIDLSSLTVNTVDYAFANSSGQLTHDGAAVVNVAFGAAMSCDDTASGAARVDLRGTPFAVDDDWQVGGGVPSGSSVYSSDDQVVDITGGGGCGWNYPGEAYNPFNGNGGADLQLRFVDEPIIADSCADMKAQLRSAGDGSHTLNLGGRSLEIRCVDMEGSPREYLALSERNTSQYTASGNGSTVTTEWDAVRLDIVSLTVDMADYTFASSTGSLEHGGEQVVDMPFGVAMSCDNSASGVARIDLRGTPLAVNDSWETAGSSEQGSAVFSSGDQVVDITGGGYCGWSYPGSGYNPFNSNAGWDLQLSWSL